MAVTVYRSTDASAPVLTGLAGTLINLLDKCLVTGYGSKAAAGWTKPYTGTNTAVFRQGGGNSFYLDVDDTGPGAHTTQEARLRGYETMTAVATGTGLFPSVLDLTAAIIVRKAVTANAVARVWTVIADDRTFYLFLIAGDSSTVQYGFAFGDFYSYVAGTDNYRTMIIGRINEGSNLTTVENADKITPGAAVPSVGHYAARSYTGLGGSVNFAKFGDHGKSGAATALNGSVGIPSLIDGNIWLSPVFVGQSYTRGKLRGFMHFLHAIAGVADQDTITGAGVYAGRTFLIIKGTGNSGVYCIDITGPWDTN